MRPVDQTAAPVVESFRVGEHMLDPARLSERRAVWEVLCNHVQRIADHGGDPRTLRVAVVPGAPNEQGRPTWEVRVAMRRLACSESEQAPES